MTMTTGQYTLVRGDEEYDIHVEYSYEPSDEPLSHAYAVVIERVLDEATGTELHLTDAEESNLRDTITEDLCDG